MDYRKRFSEIAEFLQPYQRIWQNEIMLMYPDPLGDYPLAWVEELAAIREKDQILQLERKEISGLIKNPSLISFYQKIEDLSSTPGIPDLPPLQADASTYLYMIPKKQHEIKRLAPFINSFYRTLNGSGILDIGGGIGLLAQSLVHHYHLPVHSVDMDPALQITGKKRYQDVVYKNVKVSSDSEEFNQILDSGMISVGLHTCGPLANEQMKSSIKGGLKGLINFGCCYHRLSRHQTDQNISTFSRSLAYQVVQNNYSLTLASRAHRKMSEKEYEFKLKVKFYRYAMHFLLHDEYNLHEMVTLGNSTVKLYEESFGTYALEQLQRINLKAKHTKEELDFYFCDSQRQDLIWKMLAAGFLRNALGRLLEVYILLDRVIFLEEQGYKVKLLEFFEESISPRNLGIVAQSTSKS
jgi:hypothetical protein